MLKLVAERRLLTNHKVEKYRKICEIWLISGRIICFCVCLSWNFKPSKAWNFNPSKAWKQLFVIVFRRVEISSFRRVEIKRQNRWLKLKILKKKIWKTIEKPRWWPLWNPESGYGLHQSSYSAANINKRRPSSSVNCRWNKTLPKSSAIGEFC